MALLEFPPSPAVNDTFPNPPLPGVPLWRFDGARWRSVPVASGTVGQQGPPGPEGPKGPPGDQGPPGTTGGVPNPLVGQTFYNVIIRGNSRRIRGITNGTAALTGDVGEYHLNYFISGYMTSFSGNLVSTSLTRGDWDLYASISVHSQWSPDGPENPVLLEGFWQNTTEQIPAAGQTYVAMEHQWHNVRTTFTLPRARANYNSTQSAWVRAVYLSGGHPNLIWGFMTARRVC